MKTTKNILFYCTLLGLFAVPFIAFLSPTTMFFPFITGKGFAFRILVEILFGLYLFLAVIAPEFRPKSSWITKSIGLFVLAIFIADLFSANAYKSFWSNYERMEGFVLILHLALYYIVASSVFRTASRWKQFFNVSIVASVIMSFYGVLQLLGKIAINQGGVRLDATFGNATYLAIYLVFHIFLCLYMLADARGNSGAPSWQKWTYGLIALFEAVILYFTATRGAILGLIGGLIIAAILMVWKEKENKSLRKMSRNVLIVIAIVVGLFLVLRNSSFIQKSPVLSRFSELSATDLEGQGRYFVWPMAVKGFVQSPKTFIIGWGQESFNYVFNKYYNPAMYGQEEWFDRTHDIVLDWLIAGGIVGFLAYVSMYVAMLYMVWRKQSRLKLIEKSLFTGMIAAYVFHNIFVFDNLITYIMFFSLLAYIHAVNTEDHDANSRFHSKTFSSSGAYGIGVVILVLTILALYFVNVPALEANWTLIQAVSPQSGGPEKNLELFKQVYVYNSFGSTEATEQLVTLTSQIVSSDQVPATIKQEFYTFAKQKIEEKVAESPHDARYFVFAGSFFNKFGNYDDAIKYLERAVVESPEKQSIYFELGSAYLGKGDKGKAFAEFKKAYDEKPTSLESQIIYTLGALYTNNTDVLQQMSKVLSPSVVITDNRFLKAYADLGNYTAVINILTARLQADPTNMQYKLSLAAAYSTIGQKQKAIDIINSMIAQDPSFKAQGESYIKQIQG